MREVWAINYQLAILDSHFIYSSTHATGGGVGRGSAAAMRVTKVSVNQDVEGVKDTFSSFRQAPLSLGCYQRMLAIFGVGLPTPIKTIRTILQLKLPSDSHLWQVDIKTTHHSHFSYCRDRVLTEVTWGRLTG